MAGKKPKYNPEDVERWVTVRGARIPIMKDGSFGVGTKDDDVKTTSRNARYDTSRATSEKKELSKKPTWEKMSEDDYSYKKVGNSYITTKAAYIGNLNDIDEHYHKEYQKMGANIRKNGDIYIPKGTEMKLTSLGRQGQESYKVGKGTLYDVIFDEGLKKASTNKIDEEAKKRYTERKSRPTKRRK